jgi:DNA/RNA endonuclease YhcR with UshA esterase domain
MILTRARFRPARLFFTSTYGPEQWMTKVSRRLVAFVACLGAVACSEKLLTLGQGSPSSLSVRLYVDADGDGAFNSATDVPVAGMEVTATGPAGDATQTTDATGLATFQLAPGSYTLSAAGTTPGGAVLATATQPTVVAPFQGAELTAQFRFAFLPGDVSVVVFRDDDASGTFDPALDTPGPGLAAVLTQGDDTVGTGVTDSDGAVVFATVRPGDYTLTFTPFPTIVLVGGDSRPVTVTAAASTDLTVEFTGNLVIPVSAARAAGAGTTVAVEGVITWQSFRTNLDAYVQDASGGIAMFQASLGAAVEGDTVRVIGTISLFNGDVQISPVTSVDVLSGGNVPSPRVVTADEINAGAFQGELIIIDAIVDSLQVFSFDNHNAWLSDAAGSDFFVFVDSRIGVGSADWTVGELYAVTGVLSTDTRNAFPYRVELRHPTDLVLGGSSVDIADARGMSGAQVTVEGVVTWQQQWDSRVYYFQDGTGGITTFDAGNIPLARGDRIRVRGTVGAFRGEFQLSPVSSRAVVSSGAVPAARAVTAPEILADMFQGELVSITGTVDSITVDGFDNASVYLSDANGDDFLVFNDARNGVASTAWTVGNTYAVAGVLTTDNRFIPNIPAARLEPRDAADIVMQ